MDKKYKTLALDAADIDLSMAQAKKEICGFENFEELVKYISLWNENCKKFKHIKKLTIELPIN